MPTKVKEMAGVGEKAPPTEAIEKQSGQSETAASPSPQFRPTFGASIQSNHGQSANSSSASRGSGSGVASRARTMTALQRSVGNARISRLAVPGEAPAIDEAAANSLPNSVVTAVQSGGGHSLDHTTRDSMEQSFGADFSGVRVHSDGPAAVAAGDINARAFTYGQDIYFGAGQYNPETQQGQRLLAHELTHTIQQSRQSGHSIQSSPGISRPEDEEELEAEASADRIVSGSPAMRTGASAAAQPNIQRSLWDDFVEGVSDVAGDVWGGVQDVGGAIASGVESLGSAVSSAWNAATQFLGDAAEWAWDGITSLGSDVLNWLSTAGAAVWEAIQWFGALAWEGIQWLGGLLWEKLSWLGIQAWSFISNYPTRLWRIIVHGWEGITGVLSWLSTGIQGAAGWAADAIAGIFGWLSDGLSGALTWLVDGFSQGMDWVVDFLNDPSLDKLLNGVLGALDWLGEGVRGLVRWGVDGIIAAAKWAWEGIKGLGKWFWDGVLSGLLWAAEMLLYLLELWGLGERLQLLWGLLFRLRPLTGTEIAASQSVHPAGLIPYWQVRVDEDSLLLKIGTTLASWFSSPVSPGAITTMHVIHLPKGGADLSTMVHELSHVAQYEKVGAIYMPQALHGQNTAAGYNYGDLAAARAAGKHFRDLNREQQAQVCEDYYDVINGRAAAYGGTLTTLQPFIDDMRRGEF